jgi:hypothetical protein
MNICQVAHEQRRSPNRGTVTLFAGITIDDRFDQRVDDPQRRLRSATALSISQTGHHVAIGTLMKTFDPVVDRLSAYLQLVGNFMKALAFIAPQESVGSAQDTHI